MLFTKTIWKTYHQRGESRGLPYTYTHIQVSSHFPQSSAQKSHKVPCCNLAISITSFLHLLITLVKKQILLDHYGKQSWNFLMYALPLRPLFQLKMQGAWVLEEPLYHLPALEQHETLLVCLLHLLEHTTNQSVYTSRLHCL